MSEDVRFVQQQFGAVVLDADDVGHVSIRWIDCGIDRDRSHDRHGAFGLLTIGFFQPLRRVTRIDVVEVRAHTRGVPRALPDVRAVLIHRERVTNEADLPVVFRLNYGLTRLSATTFTTRLTGLGSRDQHEIAFAVATEREVHGLSARERLGFSRARGPKVPDAARRVRRRRPRDR